jgi:2-oxoisovalerate dehydrogenase E2 component (dihydrolipoyl transacylase)
VSSGKVKASPAVRRIARQQNLDLSLVVASGRDGRVLKGDVLQHSASGARQTSQQAPSVEPRPPVSSPSPAVFSSSPSSSPPASAVLAPSFPAFVPRSSAQPDRREVLKGVRKAMIKSMTPAAQVPWFGYSDEIEMDGLMAARSALRKDLEAKGIKLTYMPFLLKAAAVALQEFPVINTSLSSDQTELVYRGSINLGVAMDTPNGLVVPNIKHAAQRSILEISVELQRLQALALAGKLGVEDLSGGTFTLSNIGNIGGTTLSPVPMPGEVAICAIGRIRKLPRYVDDKGTIAPRHLMDVSFRADHRVIDGATLARFSELWKSFVEQPLKLMVRLG